jgi:ssRNA-specific RNase YbeY (16S rRNA maturation enzyme)
MSQINVLNRDSKTQYLNKSDSNEILNIESCVNWSSLAELCIKLSDEMESNLNREICLSFCTESEIKDLNRNFRNKDSITDVLSFNFQELQDTGNLWCGKDGTTAQLP